MQTNKHFAFTSGIMVRLIPTVRTTHVIDQMSPLAKFQYLQSASFSHSGKVYNVVPGDFTYSGKLDLLVMGHDQSKGPLDLQLYEGLATGGFGKRICLHVRLPVGQN